MSASTKQLPISAPDVSDLSVACTDVKSVDFDVTEGYGDRWDYIEAGECSECGAKLIATHGEEQHKDVDESSTCEGYVSGEGPMFNYLHPLDSCPSEEEIKDSLADLPLCVVTMSNDRTGDQAYLGLTGGGMNMAGYICTAYVRLGYLPPLTYCDALPSFAGMPLEERNLVIAACKRTVAIEIGYARGVKKHLAELERTLKERKRTLD